MSPHPVQTATMRTAVTTIWRYRHFIVSSIANEFVTRFARNTLGGLWMILHPLAQVAIYTLVFSAALSAKLPGSDDRFGYAVHLMAGILAWSLFSDILTRCLTVFVDNASLIKKIAFPRLALPLVIAGSAGVTGLMLLAAILLVFLLIGHPVTPALPWLLPPLLLTAALALGLGLTLGILNVFLRDIGQAVLILLQFWFWLTPVVYTLATIPERLQPWFALNPMTPLVMACQRVLVQGQAPEPATLLYPACAAALVLLLAATLLRRSSADMVDAL